MNDRARADAAFCLRVFFLFFQRVDDDSAKPINRR